MYNKGHYKKKFIGMGQGFRSSRAHIKRHWKGRALQKGFPKSAMAVSKRVAGVKKGNTGNKGLAR